MFCRDNFIGNGRVVNFLDRSLEKGNISHAYLFEGPRHIGKMTLAIDFSAKILGEEIDNIMNNPDFISITPDPESGQIEAEKIRELQKNLSLFPFKSRYKVALIEEAQSMNSTAANALLKTLEEPGKTSVMILVSSASDRILDTIRSRCQVIGFGPVGNKALSDGFASPNCKEISGEDSIFETPGALISLLGNPDSISRYMAEMDRIRRAFGGDGVDRLDISSYLGSMEKKDVVELLDMWILFFRKKLISLIKNGSQEDIADMMKTKGVLENIMNVKNDISEKNVNMKLAIDNLCLKF